MRAAVVERPNQLVIKDIPKPTIKPNEVLIRVECASICNATDNHILEGTFDGYHDFYPQVLGHEVCGVICEVGADVTNLQLGQRIALYTPNGAFQEYVPVASDAIIAHVPDNVPSDVAAICEMFHGTYVGMLGPAMLKGTERVLIIGAGPMGLTATALASLMAKTVCVVDYFPNRLEKAVEMGADFVYDHWIIGITGHKGFPVRIDERDGLIVIIPMDSIFASSKINGGHGGGRFTPEHADESVFIREHSTIENPGDIAYWIAFCNRIVLIPPQRQFRP